MADDIIRKFEHTIYVQLRALGIELHDDAGNRLKPGSGEENRVVRTIASSVVQLGATPVEDHPDEWFIKKFKTGYASVADMMAFVAGNPDFVTQLIRQRDELQIRCQTPAVGSVKNETSVGGTGRKGKKGSLGGGRDGGGDPSL